jgi:DNA polymerase
VHENPRLLECVTDDDVYRLMRMQKSVTRDMHKMKAFVRFKKLASSPDNAERFIAWHRPDHLIVRQVAPFFARRFKEMTWTIMTPDESVSWDRSSLHFGVGVTASAAPDGDAMEKLWLTYYASIFNPARVKVDMMKREMPVRHWPTLPETSLIPELLKTAAVRVEGMIRSSEGFAETAARYFPTAGDLKSLCEAAKHCQACSLHEHATQTVFGMGRQDAELMIIGEQPGDEEDLAGLPFIGPAGQVLNDALEAAGVSRSDVYLTNVVKHFGFTIAPATTAAKPRRLHKKPGAREIYACRPWLEAEIKIIRPAKILCLGVTAAQAIFGRDFKLSKQRGEFLKTDWCDKSLATWHPSAILRSPDGERKARMLEELVADIRKASS